MQIAPTNIMESLIDMIELNRESIDRIIHIYESDQRKLNIFKGMKATLPNHLFPSLEIETGSGSMEWLTTECQTNTYDLEFTLTTFSANVDKHLEYINLLTRNVVMIFNNPANMSFVVKNEYTWNPQGQCMAPALVQYGDVANPTYGSNLDGTIRQSQWTWSGKIIEGYRRDWWNYPKNEDQLQHPHELPPE